MDTEKIPRVLVVDDEKGLRVGTGRLLEMEGFSVKTAENGTEGILLGTREDFDLAIIDMKMPDIDGIEVLRKIRKSKPNTVCFIATAYASYETAIEATRIGAFGYIPKPFSPEELIQQLNKGYSQRLLLLESEKLKKEREENLLELAGEKSRLNAIINAIISGVIVVNKTGEIVYFNHAAIKNLNLDELNIGDRYEEKMPQKVNDLIEEIISSEIKTQKSLAIQIEIIKPNELIAEIICTPVLHPDGSFAGVVLVIRNITEMKKIEIIKSQFISMVAHELKTPVAAVQGFLNILIDDRFNIGYEKQKEYLSRSVVRLSSLLDLVNDLLDISRMETKSKKREIEKLNVPEIIDNCIITLELEIKKKSIRIIRNTLQQECNLFADSNEITRVFTNLLSNAIKYNKDKGSISINIEENKNFIIARIEDTGIGMKPEEKDKLFQEFFRAKNENTRGISGTGLGLTIVRRIIESYHGKMEVESTYGIGTAFTIYLPKSYK